MGWFSRSIRPPTDITPNPNDPASVPPSTVGPDQLVEPGDPDGVVIDAEFTNGGPPPTIVPSAWSGWPAEWWPPYWQGSSPDLSGIAWACIDKNANALATMPPYLVNAAPTLDADWLRNPDSDVYTSWDEFAKQAFWDFQAAGETFVLATARYATGWPARFHVVAPPNVQVEIGRDGLRHYKIGEELVSGGVTGDLLHIRYKSAVGAARGQGPLEAGGLFVTAAQVLARYASGLATNGGIPASILEAPEQMAPEQAAKLRDDWVLSRQNNLGAPGVLTGGLKWTPTQMNPKDMALIDLQQHLESRVAVMLGVPPHLMGLPSGGDSMTYNNVSAIRDDHWRGGLRPMADIVTSALSEWLLPRQTTIELNSDYYTRPDPLVRAQTAEILNRIVDSQGNPVLSAEQIRGIERITNTTPQEGAIR